MQEEEKLEQTLLTQTKQIGRNS